MNDRGMKKWRPFNSVIPSKELLNRDEAISLPNLSRDEISEFEEILKGSMYTHSKVKVTFVEKGKSVTVEDYVLRLDPIRKDVYLKTKKVNFRQIKNVKK